MRFCVHPLQLGLYWADIVKYRRSFKRTKT
uniref:Uncharacterized protein n=1 Tax=Anguilla anguilla TaxID=7936 RepID=A0A0E9PJ24_ANGAN